MYRSSAKRLSASIVSVVSALLYLQGNVLFGADSTEKKVVKPTVIHASQWGVSPPLRTMKVTTSPRPGGAPRVMPDKPPLPFKKPATPLHDPLVQKTVGGKLIPDPIVSFAGVPDVDGVQPADMGLDVSPTQVLQWVNLSFEIYDRSGTPIAGPFEGTDFWSGITGPCNTFNGGDILVHWDQFAQQWVVAQLAYPGGAQGFHLCVAVSQTSDATGTYFEYDYLYSPTDLNDYPKFGLWPDANNNGYYVTARNFVDDSFFSGMTIMAIDRNAILTGTPGTAQLFDVGALAPNLDGLLPADLRGLTTPPTGSPETYIGYGNPATDGTPSSIHLFQTMVDFSNPDNSTLTQLDDIPVADFDPVLSNGAPQVGGGTLETLAFSMYRADYRVFGDHDSLLLLHDVNVAAACGGPEQGGERWHEVRGINVGGPPSLYQEGTYGPCDNTYRWMGSIAMDAVGNIALGLSASSAGTGLVIDPSVHYTGRMVTDPLGTMTQGEGTFLDSTQPFLGFRWGDYSTIVADPVDQCTMWYSAMFGNGDWATQIGSFKFPNCTTGPSGTLTGNVSDGTNPIAGASVSAGLYGSSTDASGNYSFAVPVGTYTVTASKFGFLPQSVPGVEITDGNTTTQNFTLAPAPSAMVNGTVKDGSGGGWPLYAKIVITAPGAPTYTMYTDPVTGYYAQTLVQGITWNFTVTAPGYLTGGGPLPLAPNQPIVANWNLTVDANACTAPGYSPAITGLFESFDAGTLPPNWQIVDNGSTGSLPDWTIVTTSPCGDFSGNLTGGTGPFAMVNSDCDGPGTFIDSALVTPSVDLSSVGSAVVRFNQDYFNLGDIADVDVSTDGGATWQNVLEQTTSSRGPDQITKDISSIAAGQANVMVRFHYYEAFFAWWWSVDNVLVGQAGCVSGPGGLVVGNVRDSNTGAGLNGATVTNIGGGSATTVATPNDPNLDDGFYILFAESGQQSFQATKTNYGTGSGNLLVVPNSTQRLDFSLGSGQLTAAPSPLNGRVDPNGTDNQTLNFTNSGNNAATFNILEINAPLLNTVTRGFASNTVIQKALDRLPKEGGKAILNLHNTKGVPAVPNPTAGHRPMTAGNVIASYPSGITYGWGVATSGADFWLTNLGVAGGDNKEYEYDSSSGAATGATVDDSSAIQAWAGDGTYNSRTGMMWHVDVVNAGSSCIFEVDPNNKVVTGNRICPNTNQSSRGLAYDPGTDTYWYGSFNDLVIYHFDSSGNVLDSANTGLPISGLAYNPANGHLLVMSNSDGSIPDITVLDANNNYAVLGAYYITSGGSPVMTPFGGAGLEFDCAGNLWAVDQNTQTIYNVESDEGFACSLDIPWLSENPTTGTVPAATRPTGGSGSNPFPVAVTFDGTGLLPGLRQAQLQVQTDTPYAVPGIPVSLVVRFLDVPDNNQFEAYIYGAAGAGVMMGGPPNCPAGILDFCPNNVVTRADMAGYIFRAVHGANTPPPVYQNIFADVLFNDYNSFYIQGIFNDGITVGCGNGDYCPNSANTRAQMAVFIWKGQHGSTPPPACTGVFADVPCPGGFAVDYIEGLFNEGVTAGCGGGNYCPNSNITNGQMAVFLVKGFNLPVAP